MFLSNMLPEANVLTVQVSLPTDERPPQGATGQGPSGTVEGGPSQHVPITTCHVPRRMSETQQGPEESLQPPAVLWLPEYGTVDLDVGELQAGRSFFLIFQQQSVHFSMPASIFWLSRCGPRANCG